MKILLFVVLGLAGAVCVYFAYLSVKAQSTPVSKGLASDGSVFPCGSKPNCVSTNDSRKEFALEPFSLKANKSLSDVKAVISEHKDVEIISSTDNYLHVVYRTSLFKFPDDVELTVIDEKLHIRSQSRAGHSDLGKNSKRISALKDELTNAGIL